MDTYIHTIVTSTRHERLSHKYRHTLLHTTSLNYTMDTAVLGIGEAKEHAGLTAKPAECYGKLKNTRTGYSIQDLKVKVYYVDFEKTPEILGTGVSARNGDYIIQWVESPRVHHIRCILPVTDASTCYFEVVDQIRLVKHLRCRTRRLLGTRCPRYLIRR